jgi:hydroxymethylglutaryl-CoA synthase
MRVGLEAISFYIPRYYIDLKTIAAQRHEETDKYYIGLGQEKMAVPPPDEDIVTMAANAAGQALQGKDVSSISTLLFATESGIDQSKAAGIYVHHLLGLPSHCRIIEMKQACYSATAGLQLSLALVAQNPRQKVLIIASDIARYGLGSAGEPTQGAGAVAMLISHQPDVISFEAESGTYCEDVMDFWRPNYLDEALVDGKYSIKIYLKALAEAWKHYQVNGGRPFQEFSHFCYHLPFTRMADKAHRHLGKLVCGHELTEEQVHAHLENGLRYGRIVGNVYTASLYLGLMSLLDHAPHLDGQRLGLFSYGSGCVAEFFSGLVSENYQQHLHTQWHRHLLQDREELDYETYSRFYSFHHPVDGRESLAGPFKTGKFRFSGINHHKRIYEKTS